MTTTAVAKTTTAQLDQMLGQGSTTIGALIFWSLSGVQVPRTELRDAFEGLQLGAAVPDDPSPEAVLRRAAIAAQTGHKDVLIRQIGKTDDEVTYGVVREQRDTAERRLGYRQEARVTVDRVSGKATTDDPDHTVVQSVLAKYREISDFANAQDLSHCIVAALQGSASKGLLEAISLRESQGGLYFVHPQHVERLRQLGTWVESATYSSFRVMTINADAENLEQAAKAARQSLQARLEALKAEVAEFVSRSKESEEGARTRSVNVRVERFKQLEGTVELYADILSAARDELLDEIRVARDSMLSELDL